MYYCEILHFSVKIGSCYDDGGKTIVRWVSVIALEQINDIYCDHRREQKDEKPRADTEKGEYAEMPEMLRKEPDDSIKSECLRRRE